MKKISIILMYEMKTVLNSKSFLITTFLLPLLGVLIFLGVNLVNQNASAAAADAGAEADDTSARVEGYVDHSGLVESVSDTAPAGSLVAYPDEASARAALAAEEIAAYYLIPADYVESGNLIYINPDYRLAGDGRQDWAMENTLFENLLGRDVERVQQARHVLNVKWTALDTDTSRDEDNPLTFFVPYATMMIFYMVILLSSSLLLSSVNNEKKNRVLEILLVSITPRQMLTGKIVALGLLGLLQAVAWIGTGYGVLWVSGQSFNLPADFVLPPSILVWSVVFFLLGYAVYASLMAGLGALVPNMREASQATMLVVFPMMIPLLLIAVLIETPHGAVSTALSLFPLTASPAMMTRLVVGGVPLWQPLLAVALLVLTAAFIVRSVANMFRAQTMLSGQPFSARRFYRALLGRG
jgi:ABC-2 type transport system permease protein